jgi:N-acetylmuramoyl-L-alanine amidase
MRNAFITLFLLAFFVSNSDAGKHNSVQGLRYASYDSHTRVVVDVDGPVDFTQHRLSNPERIYFDLKGCTISSEAEQSVRIGNGILEKVRLAQFDKGTVRVVFDVNETKNFYAFLLENPYRLVVDVYASDREKLGEQSTAKAKKVLTENDLREIRRIVIDPGHGGKDPGAIGLRGVREKDIALDVGKKLGALLHKEYGVEIIYTRDRDVFVPLNERTEMANTKKADLFISIHTNASPRRNVRGLETYFLNWTNDREATRVAARENRISEKKMRQMQNGLQFILQDLARNSKKEESMRLAHSVQNSMARSLKKDYRRVNDLGVKSALFYVLVGAEMPSVLVEISFISNREEEKRLASKKYKNTIAEAIARGINSYMTQSTLIVRPAGDTGDGIVSAGRSAPRAGRRSRLVRHREILSSSTMKTGGQI